MVNHTDITKPVDFLYRKLITDILDKLCFFFVTLVSLRSFKSYQISRKNDINHQLSMQEYFFSHKSPLIVPSFKYLCKISYIIKYFLIIHMAVLKYKMLYKFSKRQKCINNKNPIMNKRICFLFQKILFRKLSLRHRYTKTQSLYRLYYKVIIVHIILLI